MDLPSSGLTLVTSSVWMSRSRLENWMLVLRTRYASAAGERGSFIATRPVPFSELS